MALQTREFPPISEQVERPEKLSQSFLQHYQRCPRAGSFYVRYKGGPANAAMTAGTVFHRFAEVQTKAQYATGEVMPPEVARDRMMETIATSEEIVPEEMHDPLRAMAWNWATAFTLPVRPIAVEQMYEVEVAGQTLRGKIDLAGWGIDGLIEVYDYKSGRNLPDSETASKDFQLRFYAYLLTHGIPVDDGGAPDGERITGFKAVRAQQVFPMYTDNTTGAVVSRPDDGFELEAQDLHDFGQSLEGIVRKATESFASKQWPAQAGSHCSRCPAPKECPIPGHLNVDLPLSSQHEAETALTLSLDLERRKKALDKAAKDYAKENGAIQVGDLIFDFAYSESRSIDKEKLGEALASGESVDPDDLYDTRRSTRWTKRKAA